MVEALDEAGVPHEYYETAFGHTATFLFNGEQVRRAIKFLDRWLKPER